jgi:hypothetical protein
VLGVRVGKEWSGVPNVGVGGHCRELDRESDSSGVGEDAGASDYIILTELSPCEDLTCGVVSRFSLPDILQNLHPLVSLIRTLGLPPLG